MSWPAGWAEQGLGGREGVRGSGGALWVGEGPQNPDARSWANGSQQDPGAGWGAALQAWTPGSGQLGKACLSDTTLSLLSWGDGGLGSSQACWLEANLMDRRLWPDGDLI